MPKDKTKKNKEPKISYFQAITSYKINNKEKELREANEELVKLVEKNFNLKQRNERLNQTKENNFKKALEDYKKFTYEQNLKVKCEKDQVLDEMKDLWRFKQGQEKELASYKKEIKKTEKEINQTKRELKIWNDFKTKGTFDLETEISLLKKELSDMTENYEVISASLKNSLVNTIDDIKKSTEEVIQRKNKIVAEKCFKFIDKDAVEKSRENTWMKEKIEIYKQELKDLQELTTNLEQENIQLMSYLFECNNQEVNFIKNVFTTQFLDNENLEQNTIMNVDLEQLETVRPNSALDLTLKKLKEIDLKSIKASTEWSDHEESEDNLNSLKSSLYLNGSKKKLIKPPTPSDEELNSNTLNREEWPITQEMLSNALKM